MPKFVKQKFVIEHIDLSHVEPVVSRHGAGLPCHVRGLFCGSSGSGKTNALLDLILSPDGLSFKNIYVYSKSLEQPKYKFLEQVLSKIPEVGFYAHSNAETIQDVNDVERESLFIFDDIISSNQDTVKNYFSRGRHYDLDCIYLGQSYAQIVKQNARDNLNLLAIFRMDDMSLNQIYKAHVNSDMSIAAFKKLCAHA